MAELKRLAAARPGLAAAAWPGLVAMLSLALYLFTLAPGLTWADGARLQTELALRGSLYLSLDETRAIPSDGMVFDRLGVAGWDHPLYIELGQLFLALPLGEHPWRSNLMSAVAAVAGLLLLYDLGFHLTGNRPAAALAALALMAAHTYWLYAVTTENTTLHGVFLLALIGLVLRWQERRRPYDLLALSLVAGVGLANHVMLVLALVPVAGLMAAGLIAGRPLRGAVQGTGFAGPEAETYFPLRSRLTWVGAPAGLFLLGWAPWWIQFLRLARLTGLPALLILVFQLSGAKALWAGPTPAAIGANLLQYSAWLGYQFTPAGVGVGVYGMVWLWRRRRAAAAFLLTLFAIQAFWSANYPAPDRFAFHFSSYVIFALFLACGAAGLLARLAAANPRPRTGEPPRPAGFSAGPVRPTRLLAAAALGFWLAGVAALPLFYARTPALLRSLGWDEARFGISPIGDGARDALAYFLTPAKRGDDSAAAFGRGVMAGLAPDAIVYAARPGDEEAFIVLYYQQAVEGRRPDVTLRLMLPDLPAALPAAVLAEARSQAGCRPLYLASLDPALYPLADLNAEFTITPEAHLFRLAPRSGRLPGSACPGLVTHPPGLTLAQLIRSGIQ